MDWMGKVVKRGNSKFVLIPAVFKLTLGNMYHFKVVNKNSMDANKRFNNIKQKS
jgi:hypothetical protein